MFKSKKTSRTLLQSVGHTNFVNSRVKNQTWGATWSPSSWFGWIKSHSRPNKICKMWKIANKIKIEKYSYMNFNFLRFILFESCYRYVYLYFVCLDEWYHQSSKASCCTLQVLAASGLRLDQFEPYVCNKHRCRLSTTSFTVSFWHRHTRHMYVSTCGSIKSENLKHLWHRLDVGKVGWGNYLT